MASATNGTAPAGVRKGAAAPLGEDSTLNDGKVV